MDHKKLLIVLLLFITSCGGSTNGSSSRFNGTWKGTLVGRDCSGVTVKKVIQHEIEAQSDELSSDVTLVDERGVIYRGVVDGTASISGPRYGFSVKEDDDSNVVIDYNVIKTPDGQARVIESITVGEGDVSFPAGCQYYLEGIATKE